VQVTRNGDGIADVTRLPAGLLEDPVAQTLYLVRLARLLEHLCRPNLSEPSAGLPLLCPDFL
jgi:hypothetical protein